MINTKDKRKHEYMGKTYYWYVKLHGKIPKVHIVSEDKKIQLCCSTFDSEVPVTPEFVSVLIQRFLSSHEM